MNNGAGGAVPVVAMLDYLSPEINRPDLYFQQAYPVQGGSGGNARFLQGSAQSLQNNNTQSLQNNNVQSIQRHKADTSERSPSISLYYTVGLIVASAAIFLTIAAWSNVLLSWYDSMFVSPIIATVT